MSIYAVKYGYIGKLDVQFQLSKLKEVPVRVVAEKLFLVVADKVLSTSSLHLSYDHHSQHEENQMERMSKFTILLKKQRKR